MKFILHVWTRKPSEGPWVVELENGEKILAKKVYMHGSTYTMTTGHEPCANWYITGSYYGIHNEDGIVTIS